MRYLHVLLFVFAVLITTMGCSSGGGADDHTNPPTTIPAENPGVLPEQPVLVPEAPGNSNPSVPGSGETQEPGSGEGEGGDEITPETPENPNGSSDDPESLTVVQYVPEGRSHSYQIRVTVKNVSKDNITYWMVSFIPPVATEHITCWSSTSSTMNEDEGVLTWIPNTLQFRRMASDESRDMHCQINLKYRHEGYSEEEKVLRGLYASKVL